MSKIKKTKETYSKQIGLYKSSLSKSLIKSLKNERIKFFTFPKVSVNEIELDEKDFNLLRSLESFDWLIFSDIYSVEYFIDILEKLEINLFELDKLRVCTFGEAVADRLRFIQLHADVISNNFIEQEVFKQIKDYVFDIDEFKDLKMLIVKELKTELKLTQLLQENKANVKELNVYETQQIKNTFSLKALLKGGAIDEIVFFMPEEVFAIREILGFEQITEFLSEIEIYANDEITYQTLIEFHLKPKLL